VLPNRYEQGASFRRVADALIASGCNPRERGWQIDALCPVHGDRTPSLSVTWRDGRTLLHCHVCTSSATPEIVSALGLSLADLFDAPAEKQDRPAAPRRPRRASVPPVDRPKREPRRPVPLGDPVAVYTYTDEQGTVLGEVRRFEPAGERKTFRAFRVADSGAMVPQRWTPRVLYRLPEVRAAAAAGGTVWLTEGEKDADALVAVGVVATSAPFGAKSDWFGEYTQQLAGAHVVVVADADATGYERAARVAGALDGTAASVRVVRAAAGKDAHDHVAAGHGVAEFVDVSAELLTAHAEPAREVPVGTQAPLDGGPELPADVVDLGSRRRGGRGGEPPADDGVLPVVRDEYDVINGELCRVEWSRSRKRRQAVMLMPCAVRMTRRVRRDLGDGARVVVTHVDLEAERDGETHAMAGVEVDDFESLSWLRDLPWPNVTAPRHQRGRSDVLNAIAATSGPNVPMETAYGALGWRLVDGRWMYIHAAGAIDANGPVPGVRVDVSDPVARWALPEPPPVDDAARVRAACTASLELLDALPAHIAAPLLGAAYRALLGESGTTVYLLGEKATGKTGAAALTLQHYAPTVHHKAMPVPAGEEGATGPALEEMRYLVGHALMVADDLAPDRSVERSAQRANMLARSQYNQIGKLRSTRDGGIRPVHAPRSLLMLTGEDGAGAASAESRVVYVPVERGELTPDMLKSVSGRERANRRAQWTAVLARYFASRMPVQDWLDETSTKLTTGFREADADDPGVDARRADLVADLAAGWRAMLKAAVDLGALDEETAAGIWSRAWAGLMEAKRLQATVTSGRDLPSRTGELLRTLFATGAAHLEARDGGLPGEPHRWGWPVGAALLEAPRPVGPCVGWTDGATVWLEPGAVFAALEKQARAESEPLHVTKRALAGALAGANIITTTVTAQQRHFHARRRLAGGQRTVWEISAGWLWPEDDEANAPTPQPPAPAPTAPAALTVDAPGPQPEMPFTAPPLPEPAAPAAVAAPAPERPVVAVVVDVDGAFWTDGTVSEPPAVSSLPELVEWAARQPLGMPRRHGASEDGQVWIMPRLAETLGLSGSAPSRTAESAGHPALARLRLTGWSTSEKLGPWVKVWRGTGRALRLAVVGWQDKELCGLVAGEPDAWTLAWRIGEFARVVGMPYMVSHGVTGIELLQRHRPKGRRLAVRDAVEPPAPAVRRVRAAADFAWRRQPTTDEARLGWLHIYDINGMYLAAASSVRLGLGEARHVEAPTWPVQAASAPPGYWLLDPGEPSSWSLPDLFDPTSRGRGGLRWVTTPTLVLAAEMGYRIEPVEAWLYDRAPEGMESAHARMLEPWYKALRDARRALFAEGAGHDVDVKAVLTTLKRAYAGGVGRLDAKGAEGARLYRPDWTHHVMATAGANAMRKMLKAAAVDRYPLVVATDAIVYASDDPNPETAIPAGLTFSRDGANLGELKCSGSAPMEAVLPELQRPGSKPGRVIEVIENYGAKEA
jgi:hypothetical protein